MGKIIVVCFFFVGYIADNSKKLVHIFILKCSRSRMVSLVIYWVQLIQHFVTVIIDAANPLPVIDVSNSFRTRSGLTKC